MLGLSMTASAVGWTLVDAADGAVLAGDEFRVSYAGAAAAAVEVAVRVAATVQRVQFGAAEQGRPLRGIGLAFSPAAAAAAALTLEALAVAGVDGVTQIRFEHAAEALADGVGPTAAPARTAVCVLEPAQGTLILGCGGAAPTVVAPVDGAADVINWLTEAFDVDHRHPDALVLAGTGAGLDKLGRRLEQLLDLPVFVHTGARLGLARGAALALRPGAGLADPPVAPQAVPAAAEQSGPLSPAYTGALTMLVAGAVTFVASLSAALSLQLGPGRPAVEPVTNASASSTDPQPKPAPAVPAAPAAKTAPAPAAEPTPAEPSPDGEPAPESVAPAAQELPAAFATRQDALPLPPPPAAPPPSNPSLRDRIKQHVPRLPGH